MDNEEDPEIRWQIPPEIESAHSLTPDELWEIFQNYPDIEYALQFFLRICPEFFLDYIERVHPPQLPMLEPEPRMEARNLFLQTIKKKKPEVLSSLHNLLPKYQALNPLSPENDQEYYWFERAVLYSGHSTIYEGDEPPIPKSKRAESIALRKSLLSWAKDYHLNDEWCLILALRTLDLWHRSSSTKELDWEYRISPLDHYKEDEYNKRFRFRFSSWDQETETWKSYKQRLEKILYSGLQMYRKQIESADKKAYRLRARKKAATSHSDWLVDYQINCLEMNDILNDMVKTGSNPPARSNVTDSIHSLAKQIGLTLRK